MEKTPENQADSESTQGNSDKDLAAVIGPPPSAIPEAPPTKPQDDYPSERRQWTNDKGMFWVTFAGVVAVIAYTSVAAWQACLMRDQLTAMKQADKTTRESFTSVQRAFITATKAELTPQYSGGKIVDWTLLITFRNSGNTPTVDFNVVPNSTDGPATMPDAFLKKYPKIRLPEIPRDPEDIRHILTEGGIAQRMLIGPQSDYQMVGSVGWPSSPKGVDGGIPAILANKTRAFAYGAIHYHDIFEETPEHVTKYCFGIEGEETKDGIRPRTYRCAHWNCADDECKRDKRDYETEVTKAFRDIGAEVPPEFSPQIK